MKPRLRPSLLPQCWSCVRSYVEAGTVGWKPFGQQTRGLKAVRNQPNVIAVQLQEPLDGYGKPGTYVPVSAGRMRNLWFPKNVARYAVGEELRAIKAGKITVERDVEFKSEAYIRQRDLAARREKAIRDGTPLEDLDDEDSEAMRQESLETEREPMNIEAIDPQRAIDLIDVLLPSKIEFTRAVQGQLEGSGPVAIYGSVSTTDIATSIKTLLAHNDEAARITLSEENIELVDLADSDDHAKLKHLGNYTIKISVKGTDSPVTRKVSVSAQGEL